MKASVDLGALLVSFVVALTVAALATPIVSRLARAFEVIDKPGERKVNERANIPLLGGIAVALGVFVGLSVAVLLTGDQVEYREHLEALLIGGTLLLGIGAYDDRFALPATPKFAVQIAVAAIAIYYGFSIAYFRDPLTQTSWALPTAVVWILTTLWIVGITNAMNLIDGLDGLATGVGAIIAATLTLVCYQAGEPLGVYLGVVFVGALLGFLPFNFQPARIFLGDTGALFIGYVLALLALEGYRKFSVLTFVVPILALAVPLLDTVLSVLRRLRRGKNPFTADRLHMHHRLLQSEGSQRAAVLSIYFLTACFCVIALSFTNLEGFAAIVFLAAVILLTIRLLRNLGFFDPPPDEGEPAPRAAASGEGKGS